MRLLLAIANALLLSVPALAEDAKQDAPVPMKDGDKVEAICTLLSSAGFKAVPTHYEDKMKWRWEVLRWTPFHSEQTNVMAMRLNNEITEQDKFRVVISNKKVNAYMLLNDSQSELLCKPHRRQGLISSKFHIDCESAFGDLQFNLDTRKMSRVSLLELQDVSGIFISERSRGFLSIGSCDILSGAKHLKKREGIELMK